MGIARLPDVISRLKPSGIESVGNRRKGNFRRFGCTTSALGRGASRNAANIKMEK